MNITRSGRQRGGEKGEKYTKITKGREEIYQDNTAPKDALFKKLEIAHKMRTDNALNALNIVNEHFILGYDTPPNSRIWNIVNEYYGFGEIKTNRKK